jgi:hypothetical protein
MHLRRRSVRFAVVVSLSASLVAGCAPGTVGTPVVTSVGRSVGTVVQISGVINDNGACNTSVPASPDAQAWFNALPPVDRTFSFVGYQIWRNTNGSCLSSRRDAYRALVTFNMASVSQLKGLVTKAELVVNARALPSGVGADAACVPFIGGAASLERFGPNAAPLPPVSGAGSITVIPPNLPGQFTNFLAVLLPSAPFPSGNTVYVMPRPWVSGAVPAATSPTATLASGTGGATFVTDVTGQVVSALNSGAPGMSWMLTGAMEGPFVTPAPANVDCRTSYDLDLRLTHY